MSSENREKTMELGFLPSSRYTLGVEVEFQTLDEKTLNLSPLAPTLMANAPAILKPRLAEEFIQSILEIQTGICFSLVDVEYDLQQTCLLAEELARDNGCLLHAASLHPFARIEDQVLTENVRYQRIMDELQIVGRQFISQGLHVHIGMEDGETAVRVCNAIQAYLPLLLALSASSPYFQGEDTGLVSYRTKLFEALPLAGMYGPLTGWGHYKKEVEFLVKAGIIESFRDLWWDTRINPELGTIEVRICDLPTRFSDILALVAYIQALVATLAEEKTPQKEYNSHVLRANKWQAARFGLQGTFYDPSGKLSDERLPILRAVELLLQRITPMSVRLGSESYLVGIERILQEGTGADYQRMVYRSLGDLRAVIRALHREFWR